MNGHTVFLFYQRGSYFLSADVIKCKLGNIIYPIVTNGNGSEPIIIIFEGKRPDSRSGEIFLPISGNSTFGIEGVIENPCVTVVSEIASPRVCNLKCTFFGFFYNAVSIHVKWLIVIISHYNKRMTRTVCTASVHNKIIPGSGNIKVEIWRDIEKLAVIQIIFHHIQILILRHCNGRRYLDSRIIRKACIQSLTHLGCIRIQRMFGIVYLTVRVILHMKRAVILKKSVYRRNSHSAVGKLWS